MKTGKPWREPKKNGVDAQKKEGSNMPHKSKVKFFYELPANMPAGKYVFTKEFFYDGRGNLILENSSLVADRPVPTPTPTFAMTEHKTPSMFDMRHKLEASLPWYSPLMAIVAVVILVGPVYYLYEWLTRKEPKCNTSRSVSIPKTTPALPSRKSPRRSRRAKPRPLKAPWNT